MPDPVSPAPGFTWEILLALACVLMSGFFSASETALTALPETKVRQYLESGERRYRVLRLWLEHPNRVLTTILIGNNVVNILAAALATHIADAYLRNKAVAVATGVTTLVVLIFGEISPKTFAKHNAARMAPVAMQVVRALYYLWYPLTIAFSTLSKAIVKTTGGDVSRTGPFVTEGDIAYLIELGQREGVLEKDEKKLLESVFEFGDTLVREVMVPRTAMVAADAEMDAEELTRIVLEAGHSRIPVYEGSVDSILGIFHAKDLFQAWQVGAPPFELRAHLRKPYFVPEVMRISELLKEFQHRKVHMAVVVDEYGGTAGIVTLEDLLEEIVGEIQDEYDIEPEPFRILGDGRMLADGRASIHLVGEKLGTEFPDSDTYETLGGFLTEHTGGLPREGSHVFWNEFDFHIREADERRVRRVEIRRMEPPPRTVPPND